MKTETETQRAIRVENLQRSRENLLIAKDRLRESFEGYDNPMAEELLDTAKHFVGLILNQIDNELTRRIKGDE